jgi:hypothetical protein
MRFSKLARFRSLIPQLVLTAGLFHAPALLAATCISAQTGNWNVAATWQAACGGVPGGADTVTIQNTHTVTVTGANARADSLVVANGGILIVTNRQLRVDTTTTISGTLTFNNAGGDGRFDGLVTVNGTWSNTGNAPVDFRGSLTINTGATFTAGTGTYTFDGGAAQTITGPSGASTTFANLTLNNVNGLSLANTHSLTVTTLLTLSAGKITTNAGNVYISNGSAIGSAGATDFIDGNLKKRVAAGTNVLRTFEVGMGAYCPLSLLFASVTVAGDITVSCTSGSHPQLATSGLDTTTPAKLNRWWTIANDTTNPIAFSTYGAAFTYVATDIDTGANSAAFVAMRYAGGWNPTTLSGTPSNTLLTITSEAGFGDFAIGEGLGYNINQGSIGRFNAFNTGGPVQGYITTRTAGAAFSLTVVHLTTTGLALQGNAKFDGRVELLDASPTGGTFTNNCSSAWTTVIYDSGVVTNLFNNQNTITFNFPAVVNSWPDVRVRITRTSGGAEVGCSFDRFAIKPAGLLLEALDGDWRTAGTARLLHNAAATGGNVHAASVSTATTPRPFTLRATAFNAALTPAKTTNYAGNPTIKSGSPACVLPSGCVPATGTGTLTVGSWTGVVNTGIRTADSHYSEAGTFNLEIEDTTFAAVDTPDTALAARTISQSSPAPREIGRFVPDRFTLTAGATPPVLQTFGSSCATRSFTYVGQPFWYTTAALPSATITAVNAAGNVTTNYKNTGVNGLFKLTASGIAETYSNNSVGPAVSCMKNDLTAACTALPSLSAGNGIGTYTVASSGSVLVYIRSSTTPGSPYAANISLTVNATDSSESSGADGNPGSSVGCSGACPALTSPSALVFNGGGSGIAFDAGNEFRYGRMRILNGAGPSTVDLPVTLRAEYYVSAAAGFAVNTADSCSSFVQGNFKLFGHQGGITTGNMPDSNVSISGAFVSGAANLKLLKSNAATPGSVRICLDLDPPPLGPDNDASCTAATQAGKTYFQGPWSGGNYDKDPAAQMTFGLFGSQPRNFIFQRENF